MRDDDRRSKLPRGIWWAVGGLIVVFVVGSIASFYFLRAKARTVVMAQAGSLSAGAAALENFDFAAAAGDFSAAASSSAGFQGIAGAFSLFTNGKNVVSSFADLTKNLASLSSTTQDLEGDMFSVAGGTNGAMTVRDIETLRATLRNIDTDSQSLSSAFSFAGSNLPGGMDLFSLQTKLHSAESFLDAFEPWFASSIPHHVLVLLMNPAELRATGGFLGSYADVTIASGTIENIAVHDIADVDAGFAPKIIPPQPLQLENPNWRPADANWFFDYPTSASETIHFFEQAETGDTAETTGTKTTYDGAIAVSSDVIGDLLSITGPVTVSSTTSTGSGQATFNSANFLIQLQKIIQDNLALQSSGARRPKSLVYPKQIIGGLSTAIFAQLAVSTDQERSDLLSMAENWITDKDIMVYFKDPTFENFAASYGADGGVYNLPNNFEGDYLALVDTNINGQKSDLYVNENVNWQSQINDDGTVSDHLSLVRAHTGNTSPYWWYDAPNQTYFQLFTVDGSTLTNASGGVVRTIPAPVNYAKLGYSTDPLVVAIQSSTQSIVGIPSVMTHEESGKEVFSAWSRVVPGASTTLSFDYTHRLFLPVTDGTSYQFIFDKQTATNRTYTFEIDAPLGYVFQETGIASWTMNASDTASRLIQNLTLEKI